MQKTNEICGCGGKGTPLQQLKELVDRLEREQALKLTAEERKEEPAHGKR